MIPTSPFKNAYNTLEDRQTAKSNADKIDPSSQNAETNNTLPTSNQSTNVSSVEFPPLAQPTDAADNKRLHNSSSSSLSSQSSETKPQTTKKKKESNMNPVTPAQIEKALEPFKKIVNTNPKNYAISFSNFCVLLDSRHIKQHSSENNMNQIAPMCTSTVASIEDPNVKKLSLIHI